MKKIIPLFILIQAHLGSLSAQVSVTGIGPSAGGANASLDYVAPPSSTTDINAESKWGSTGGVRLDLDLGQSGVVKTSPEIFFIQNGAKQYYTDFSALQSGLIQRRVNLNNFGLYLPLTFYIASSNGQDQFDGLLISLKGYGNYTAAATVKEEQTGLDTPLEFRRTSDRMDLGAGAEVCFAKFGAVIRLAYNYGLKNIQFANALAPSTNKQEEILFNNRGFTISAGYLFKVN